MDNIGAYVSGVYALIGALIGTIGSYFTNRLILRNQRNKEEITSINEKINNFYAPFQQLLITSDNLHNRAKQLRNDNNFSFLAALLKDAPLNKAENSILTQILVISDQMDQLILAKCGLVDDIDLIKMFGTFSTHNRLLHLADDQKLKGKPEDFDKYKFPHDMMAEVKRVIDGLKEELKNKKKRLY